ncbi:unnamed protein product [Didymodactylos carnosus]|uniref:TRPM SLOG domain-containing protein n=1 Tax=Didymodactylos carnosus TaxID=1234261 RepID=A0A815S612_9BILA|nr:unnamed protein product [Didymodactylos carnosus]CAF4350464.1 unnamed protein product [Didymodactylos carnosus]
MGQKNTVVAKSDDEIINVNVDKKRSALYFFPFAVFFTQYIRIPLIQPESSQTSTNRTTVPLPPLSPPKSQNPKLDPLKPIAKTSVELPIDPAKVRILTLNEIVQKQSLDPPEPLTKSNDTLAEEIVEFMRDAWNLHVPNLIISVTGGAKYFKFINPRTRDDFQNGLFAAAVTTDAWIFTGGTNAGIMKEVGDAINRCRYRNTKTPAKIPVIGICGWKYITGNYRYYFNQPNLFTSGVFQMPNS